MDSLRVQISKEFFDQAEGRGIFVDHVPADAHCTWSKSRTMRDIFALWETEADFQQLLDELTGATNNLSQHNG